MRLAATVSILLLLLIPARAPAADARFVQVGKTVWYTQSGAGSPTNQINAYQFRARVDATKADAIGADSLKPPSTLTTRALSNLVTYWEF